MGLFYNEDLKKKIKTNDPEQPSMATAQQDIIMYILPHCGTIQTLARLSQTSRMLHHYAKHCPGAKKVWLQMISDLTGYDATSHDVVLSCHDFFDKLKLLACPWLVIPQAIHPVFEPSIDPDSMRITLFDKDDSGIALWYRDVEDDGMYQVLSISKSRPESVRWAFNGIIHELPQPETISAGSFHPIVPPARLRILVNQKDCHYFYQKIHKNAFAIIEITAWDMEQRNGIYFFSSNERCKQLRHIVLGMCPVPTNMIIRPMEMWMLTEEKVIYFGPSCARLPLRVEGRMDEAMWFAGHGHAKKAMKALSELGIKDINTHSFTGSMTLLHVATIHGRIRTACSLLAAKANPEERDDKGLSCLMLCAMMENPDMIRLLCSKEDNRYGAQPNAVTRFNETALHFVGHQSTVVAHTEMTVKALLDCMADPNVQDAKGQTPLFNYTILDDPQAVMLLCSNGANPMHQDHNGRTPLHVLFDISHNHESSIMLVKTFGADINAQDANGMTPLMLAANLRAHLNVKVLLNTLHADPHLCDHKGKDALWYATHGEEAPEKARTVIRMIEKKCAEWVTK